MRLVKGWVCVAIFQARNYAPLYITDNAHIDGEDNDRRNYVCQCYGRYKHEIM